MINWTDEDRLLLGPYVTALDGDVYCLRRLPPEVAAVVLAYASRSPHSFRENLLQLLRSGELAGIELPQTEGNETEDFAAANDKAQKFHEKWVVGYGHASVAEHAELRFGLDAVSIVASKVIEDNRLASFTEKSTRYQLFDRDAFVPPPELAGTEAGALVAQRCSALLDTYEALQEPVRRHLRERFPNTEGVKPAAWQRAIEAKVCDTVRYVLPAGTRTAIGLTINARAAAHAIRKLLSHPLGECRALGTAMLEHGRRICPALLRYANENEYLRDTPADIRAQAEHLLTEERSEDASPRVRMVHHDEDGEDRVLAAILYEAGGRDYGSVLKRVAAMSDDERQGLLDAFVARRGEHDWALRPLEATSYTTEIVVDYGAFRDIQRHRIATQLNPLLEPSLGFETPEEIDDAGLGDVYREAMEKAADTWTHVSKLAGPEVAQYVLPLAYRKRVLFRWNLRELEHFVRLRAGRQGHRSYRRVAWDLADAVAVIHPRLATLLVADREEYSLERLLSEDTAERKRIRAWKKTHKQPH